MKTLFIVRHAKSSWQYDGIKDIDRPLKKRGIDDAYLVSGVLQKKIETPAVFVSSCANKNGRSRQLRRSGLIGLKYHCLQIYISSEKAVELQTILNPSEKQSSKRVYQHQRIIDYVDIHSIDEP